MLVFASALAPASAVVETVEKQELEQQQLS